MQKIIDIHCHMFNLKYLPVAGIIRRYSNNKVPHVMSIGVEWLFIKNTGESFSVTKPKLAFAGKPAHYNMPLYEYLDEKKFEYKMQDVFDFKKSDSITAVENMALVGDVLEGKVSNALDEYQKLVEPIGKELKALHAVDEPEKIRYRAGLLTRMLNWIVSKAEALKNYIKWFVFMTNSEEDLYDFIVNKDEKGIETYLHLLMDVDHFFNAATKELKYKSYFDFEESQLPNMQQLNAKHSNLIGFVAFNPARKNCMSIIKDAIEKKGFKGVKFYPPLGYKAFGDLNYAANIEALMTYCETNRIPLFTHCNNQGFEAWPKPVFSGYNSNPKYWEQALIKYPKLILCLAHAGGVEGWFTTNQPADKINPDDILAADIKDLSEEQKNWNNSYAAMVYKLCVKYDNVYCDAAYLDEMVLSNGEFNEEAKENFKKRLLKLFTAQPKFSKKIMYGSDWHMLFQEGKNNVYLSTYKTFFTQPELAPYADNFFYGNAKKYLNIIG